MKKSWKTLTGRCIYQSPDGIKVHQNLLYRWLTLDSELLQTLINRYQPQKPSLQYMKHFTFALLSSPAANCCLLGLGGGGVAHAISAYLKNMHMVAIECNLDVIHIASRYFMTDRIKNLEIVHQDANIFVQTCKTSFKNILIDIYNGDAFPTNCNHSKFFDDCHRLLLPDGVLTINLASLDEAWVVLNHLREHFKQKTVCIPVKGTANIVILATKHQSVTSLLRLFEQQSKNLIWDPQWGYMAMLT